MNLAITYPGVLFCGGIIACMIVIFWWTKKPSSLPVFQFTHLLTQTSTPLIYVRLYRALLLIIIGGCFFVLSYPKRTETKQHISKSGIDIVVALDVSYSMEANDLTPNRLESAKRALQQFLASRSSDRIGLVLFAGKPFTSVPLTFDYTLFEEILTRTTTTTIDQRYQHLQGTAIGDALLSSMTLLEKATDPENTDRERIIVLFTDGEANVGVDPKVAAQLATEKQIKIYTVGIGSLSGGTIQVPTAFGVRQQQVSGIDEATLRAISETTAGIYARAVDDNSLEQITQQIAKLTRTDAETETYTTYQDARPPFIIGLLMCMLVVLWIDRKVLL